MIEDEIRYEELELEKIEAGLKDVKECVLVYSDGSFHYREKTDAKVYRYIKKTDRDLLRRISGIRYLIEKSKILESNIRVLKASLDRLADYDEDGIYNKMPKAHRAAADFLRDTAPPDEVIQSENPKYREDLKVTALDGLKLRTKGELDIYQLLKSYDLNVLYEKALVLKERVLLPNGDVVTNEVTLYPDFTIILPDGFKIYWEVCGLYDKPSYRRNQFDKFNLYYDNGIYPPFNLIVTMESKEKPINMILIRRIIEGEILPRVKECLG
ncbi:MAG: hypothetical protein J6Q41_03870 [Firmicutes bacterium]|nr:hypothetical protein [Bacillota bacterium]